MSSLYRLPIRAGLLPAALLIFGPAPAQGETYRVGPDREYTELTALPPLQPGDLVEVDGDHTYQGGVVFEGAGTASDPVVIRGLHRNAQRPHLDGGANTVEFRANHYVFEGFEITGGTSRCVFHHADDITIRDSVVHDCPQQGILGADDDSGDLTLEYVEVYHCGSGTLDHQIYMATNEEDYPHAVFRMEHCYVHDGNGGHNVKSRAERNEIYYNWIEGAYYHELELIGPDGSPDLYREDSDVACNVLRKTGDNAGFYVIRVGGDGTGETNGRYRFVNNTIVLGPSGGSAVFRLFDGLESIEMHNNLIVRDGGTGAIDIYRDAEADWASGQEVMTGSNNWVLTGSSPIPSGWTRTLFGTDPGLEDLSEYDLRPLADSPLVDAGDRAPASPAGFPFPDPLPACAYLPPPRTLEPLGSAVPRPAVGGVDIGAYEYGSGPPVTPPDAGIVGGDDDGAAVGPDAGSAGEADEGPTVRGGCGCRSGVDSSSVIIVLLVIAFLIARRSPFAASGTADKSDKGADRAAHRRGPTRPS